MYIYQVQKHSSLATQNIIYSVATDNGIGNLFVKSPIYKIVANSSIVKATDNVYYMHMVRTTQVQLQTCVQVILSYSLQVLPTHR